MYNEFHQCNIDSHFSIIALKMRITKCHQFKKYWLYLHKCCSQLRPHHIEGKLLGLMTPVWCSQAL